MSPDALPDRGGLTDGPRGSRHCSDWRREAMVMRSWRSWRCALLVFDTVVVGCGGEPAAAVDDCVGAPERCRTTPLPPPGPPSGAQCSGHARPLPAAPAAEPGDAGVGRWTL